VILNQIWESFQAKRFLQKIFLYDIIADTIDSENIPKAQHPRQIADFFMS